MATIKSGNGKGKYRDANAKADVIAYITNPSKTPHGYIGGHGVDFNDPAASMNAVSASFGKPNGVQLRHFIISFDPRELSDYTAANIIADKCAEYAYYASDFKHYHCCGYGEDRTEVYVVPTEDFPK